MAVLPACGSDAARHPAAVAEGVHRYLPADPVVDTDGANGLDASCGYCLANGTVI